MWAGRPPAHTRRGALSASAEGMGDSDPATVGGEPVIRLSRPVPAHDAARPAFVAAEILPGRGMLLLQLQAHLPGRGVTTLLDAPPLERARSILDEESARTPFPGNASFGMGCAILVPYANRIRGTRSPDGRTIRARVAGGDVTLPANWSGKAPGAERYAMHGLFLDTPVRDVERWTTDASDRVRGTANAGDFGAHWPSRTALRFEYALSSDSFDIEVTATNVGDEMLPMGIGSHPYFRLPSGDRTQARVHVPARSRAVIGDYDTVLPTGELLPVTGTPYDLSAPDGRTLGALYLDDCFTDLAREPDGSVVSSIVDPAAGYGVRIIGRSRYIAAVQVYAPLDRAYVALEPQFNLADPFGAEWARDVNTGMVMVAPGESVDYRVSLELFTV